MTIEVNLEMSLSRVEFLRLLPAAVGGVTFREEGDAFIGGDRQMNWTLRLVPLADRRLGSVVLPCHRVEIRLEGYSEAAGEAFLVRFLRGFQRGGG